MIDPTAQHIARLSRDSMIAMADRAAEVAQMLKLVANEKRLLVLCELGGAGEMNVGPLALQVGLSQSALSQHLAKMRDDGLVATRRDGHTIYYRIADARVKELIDMLYKLFCADNG